MKILETLIDSLTGKDLPVRNVCCGVYWTAVTTRRTGLASTYREQDFQHSDDHCMVQDSGRLTDKTAGELVEDARSSDTVSASIGMAAINSLIEVDEWRCTDRGAYQILAEKGRNLDVAVVGHFPFIPKLSDVVRNLWVIEKTPRRSAWCLFPVHGLLQNMATGLWLIAGSKLLISIIRTWLALERAARAAVPSSPNKQLEALGMFSL
jgi:uncharacterized protein (DUF4213/DUF364 family)